MRILTIILFVINLTSLRAQELNSITFDRDYKQIEVKPNVSRSEIRDTFIIRDTVRRIDTVVHPLISKDNFAEMKQVMPDVYSPLNSIRITSKFGMRFHPIKRKWLFHSGVDFGANSDTVRSVISGKVHSSGHNSGLGFFIKVQTGDYIITYAHLSQYFHLKNENVIAGQPLGITGNTGLSTGEHLHLSVHQNNKAIDPIEFIKTLFRLKTILANNNSHEKRRNNNINN